MKTHGTIQSHRRVCCVCGNSYIQGPGQVACSSKCAKIFKAQRRASQVDALRAVADVVRGEPDQRTIFDALAESKAAKLGVVRASQMGAQP